MIVTIQSKIVIKTACRYDGANINEIKDFVGDSFIEPSRWRPDNNHFRIKTLEGQHIVIENDWIIKGLRGEFYPCKQDIFEKTYNVIVEVGE